MHPLSNRRKRPGQALVEFALSATLLFMILSVMIDFGLAFFAYQGIAGASQEGVAYAAMAPTNGSSGTPDVNDTEIRKRVRYEAGLDTSPIPNRARFVNLFDLNNDKIPDTATQWNSYIEIKTAPSALNLSMGTPRTCANTAAGREVTFCDMVVTVRYDYRPFFAGASLLGASKIELRATRQMTIGR